MFPSVWLDVWRYIIESDGEYYTGPSVTHTEVGLTVGERSCTWSWNRKLRKTDTEFDKKWGWK